MTIKMLKNISVVLIFFAFALFTTCASLKIRKSSLELVHDNKVIAQSFCKTENELAVITNDGIMTLWDITNREKIRQIDTGIKDSVKSMIYTALDGIIVHYSNDTLVVYDPMGIRNPTRINPIRNISRETFGERRRESIVKMAYSPDNRCIVIVLLDYTYSEDKKPSGLSNNKTQYTKTVKENHSWTLRAIAMSPNTFDFSVNLHSAGLYITYKGTEEAISKAEREEMNRVERATSLAISPGGLIACGFSDGNIRIYDGKNKRRSRGWKLDNFVGALSFSPNDRYLLTGSSDRFIRIWDKEVNWTSIGQIKGMSCNLLIYSPDGDSFIAGDSTTYMIYNARNGKLLQKIDEGRLIDSVLYKENKKITAIGIRGKSVFLWDLTI
jgi:WD40 repeat protein